MKRQKFILLLMIGMVLTSCLGFVSAITTTQIFFDGFESNNLVANWTADAKYSISTGTVYAGTYAVLADGGSANVLMVLAAGKNINNQTTCNLTSVIQIHSDLDGGEYLCMDYSIDGGSTWNRNTGSDGGVGGLCQDGNVDTESVWRNITYPFSASGITSFKVRFRLNTNKQKEDGYIDNVNLTCYANNAPTINNITASNSTLKGGNTITIYANTSSHGVNDSEADTLYLYCDNSTTPTAANTDCTGGVISDSTYPYALTCTFATPITSATNIEYCRVYDGSSYSTNVLNITYTTDITAPTTSIISVAGDTSASYYDTANDGRTNITISGETGMSCRWSVSDVAYSSMANDCVIGGTQANCSVNDVASQGFTTRYISCKDYLGNEQNSSNNLNVQFYLDYTAPTTSDNSVATLQAPNYVVTITEADNVDSDPTTLYCIDTTGSCSPSLSIDNGGIVTFTSANRGVNYLRYNSTDDAGNQQATVNKTININRLSILLSAVDDAIIIKGGTIINVSANFSDLDSGQESTLYVCSGLGATASGCTSGHYCNTTGTTNLSCIFTSETNSAVHNWYAYIFDDLNEAATNNLIAGSYTTDSTGPSITIVTPANDTFTDRDITASIILNEAGNSAWYNLDNNATANITMTNSSSTSWSKNIYDLSLGNHNIIFYANDSYGNIGTSSVRYFTISLPPDTTAPAITIISPGNASYQNPASTLVNITADESLKWAGYQLNGGSISDLGNVSLTNWHITLTTLSQETTYNLTVYANDTSDNQNNKTILFYADSSGPRYSNAQASPSPANVSQAVNCSITWNDGFGITSVKISENSAGTQENHTISFSGTSGSASYNIVGSKLTTPGTYTCIFYAQDSAGNSNSTSVNFNVNDVTSPVITVTSPSNGATYNQENLTISITANENLSWAGYSLDGAANVSMNEISPVSWNANLTGLSKGDYELVFSGNDSSGNIGSSSTISFTINVAAPDTTPPIITINTLSNATYYTSTTKELNITTNEDAIWAGYILNSGSLTDMSNSSSTQWNATLSGLGAESTNLLEVYANDTTSPANKGNTNITFYVDTLAPRITNVSAIPNPANVSQSVICNAYVNDSFGLTSVKIGENSSGSFENHTIDLTSSGWMNYTISSVSQGGYTCRFYATDVAGNKNLSESTTFSVNDVTAPVISINSPLNQTYSSDSILLSVSLNENAGSAVNYSLNGGTNISLSGSGSSWSDTVVFSDGSKTIEFFAEDSSGNLGTNSITFYVDTSINDITPPTITIWSPVNGTYDIDGSVLLNITTNEALSWAGYSNNSDDLNDLDNVSTTNWNATVTFAEGRHNLTFYANDTSSNQNQGNTSLIFYVDLTNPSVDDFSCTDVNDSVDVVCSANVSDAIGLNYAIIGYNATGSWQNSSQISLSGISDTLSYTIASGNTTPVGFTAQIYLYDSSGRNNLSESDAVVISDDTSPEIYNLTYIPNSTALLDPGTKVNINATIVEDYNISSVDLMYKNSSASDWTSVTMTNNSALIVGSDSTIVYNASFTPENETWYFKINATDNAGNQNISVNYALVVENDTSQNISTDIPSVKSITYAQRTGNNSLGNLIMNNTGDGGLNFNITLNSVNIANRLSVNYTGNQTANFSVSSGLGVNITIDVNTTGLIVGLYNYNITIESDVGIEVFSRQLNIQTAEGAYLEVSIDTYSSSVVGGQTDVELIASVTNLGTADATGVYLNWSLPSEFSITSGSVSRNLGVLPIGGSGTNSIKVSISGNNINVNLTAIATSTNTDSVNDSKVVAIGSPAAAVISAPAGGGGGGTVGGGGTESATYSKIIEVVRGEKNSFEIEVYNRFRNSTLEDLTLDLSGFPEQYISIYPNKISRINYNETRFFTITLNAPTYKSYEEHDLKAIIRGIKMLNGQEIAYTETQNIKLIIQEISKEKVLTSLNDAEEAINLMTQQGYCIGTVQELLNQANQKLDDKKNSEANELFNQIIEIKEKSFRVDSNIRRVIAVLNNPRMARLLIQDPNEYFEGDYSYLYLKEKISQNPAWLTEIKESSRTYGVNGQVVLDGEPIDELVNLALLAFERCDYDLAEQRIDSAQSSLLLSVKGNFFLFVLLYWPFILFGASAFSITGIVGYRKYKKSNVTNEIEKLDGEENNIGKLIQLSQKNYFLGKISSTQYHSTMDQHERKIAEIKKRRINLRNKRIRLLKPQQVVQDLKIESMQIESEIKKLQKEYYLDKKISEKEYNVQFKILNERLAENEGERATLELIKEKTLQRQSKTNKEDKFLFDGHKIESRLEKEIKQKNQEKRIVIKKEKFKTRVVEWFRNLKNKIFGGKIIK